MALHDLNDRIPSCWDALDFDKLSQSTPACSFKNSRSITGENGMTLSLITFWSLYILICVTGRERYSP